MGNCGSKNSIQANNNEIKINEIPISVQQINIETQKSSDDSHSTQIANTEMICSTPEIDEEIVHSIEEVHSAPVFIPPPIIEPAPRPKSPLQVEVNVPEVVNAAPPPSNKDSKPLLKQDSVDRLKTLFNDPPTPQQLAAVQRIQRLARIKSAWRLAETERDWKVFPNLFSSLFNSFLQ